MRSLLAAPASFVDRSTGRPAFGSYAGPLPEVVLGGGALTRMLRRKKWLYVGLASDELWISLAVVRTGYAANAFVFVFDRGAGRLLFERNVVGLLGSAEVVDDPRANGVVARFDARGATISVGRRAGACELRARVGELVLDVVLDEASASTVSAIASLGHGLPSATEKRALMPVRGSLACGGRRFVLDGGYGGYDYTQGLMPRRTRWRWAFAMGRARDGRPIGFNLTQGFVGEAECAAFRERVFALAEPRFEVGSRSWTLTGDGIDLHFDVGAVYAQRTNLVLVRTRFIQPAGHFRGTVRLGDEDVAFEGLPGVVEDQDVVW